MVILKKELGITQVGTSQLIIRVRVRDRDELGRM